MEPIKGNKFIFKIKKGDKDEEEVDFILPDKYSKEQPKIIGKGGFGVVIAATDSLSGERCAIKKVEKLFTGEENDNREEKRLVRELKILDFLRKHKRHPNVLLLKEILMPQTNFKEVYFVTELMDLDLFKLKFIKGFSLTIDHIKLISYGILCALKFIHSANIIHRDLKPGNILLSKKFQVKLADFGLARDLDMVKESPFMTKRVQTRYYRAPEVLLDSSSYNNSIDLWSFGCILAELLGGKILFQGDDVKDQLAKIVSTLGYPVGEGQNSIDPNLLLTISELENVQGIPFDKLFPNQDKDAVDLISKLLVYNPLKRLSASECIEHTFFKKVRKKNQEFESDFKYDWSWDDHEVTKANIIHEIIQMAKESTLHEENKFN